jgi:hypothetical protein
VNLEALQSNIDLMRQLGIINADLDARKHANLELGRRGRTTPEVISRRQNRRIDRGRMLV